MPARITRTLCLSKFLLMTFQEIPGCLHDDPPLTELAKSLISALNETESNHHWDRLVSLNKRHFMLLEDSDWPSQLVATSSVFYSWLDDWNNDSPDQFSSRLRTLDLAADVPVFIFWMRETGARTNWGTFTDNWINFLYEDEGCIVVTEESTTSLVLSNGHCWVGNRADYEA